MEVEGYENLGKGPAILVPNHKSNIDPIAILVALKKQTKEEGIMNKIPTFLAKKELSKKRIVKNALSILDTFYIDRTNIRDSLKQLNAFGSYVKDKRTFGVIFPEGTRVKSDELGEFKPGAFRVALKNYLPIVPVAITNSKDSINPKRVKTLVITVKFLTPLKPNNFITMDENAIATKTKFAIEGALNE
ncbi:UNVERIFIED_CONTAM: lysophospholipid acyltransferase family protein [Campylobacter lari]